MRKYAAVAFVVLVMMFVGWQISKPQFGKSEFASTEASSADLYTRSAQTTFNNRCIVCHSCNNAPCQLNLTSYQGLRRGASKTRVYQGARQHSIEPSRLDIDATNEQAWRSRGFFGVVDGSYSAASPLLMSLMQKRSGPLTEKELSKLPQVLESHTCPEQAEMPAFYKENPNAGMPYGLPSISSGDMSNLLSWIDKGAPAQVPTLSMTTSERSAKQSWEDFLNAPSNESKLVARYIYEHLFLAHIHFSNTPQKYFRLVRSRTSCSEGAQEIATRRPNDDPKQSFNYCFSPIQQTIVEKTHLPYLMDQAKLQWTQKNFYAVGWQVKNMPDYTLERSANPFETFVSIPVEARYRFLLEDARYHVATFIKGPVCNGNMAVNAIDDHFYVFFYDPNSDLSVKDPAFHHSTVSLLSLPAENGSDPSKSDLASYFAKYPALRNQYRKIREAALKKNFPEGLSLNQIWNGNNTNDNAVLTVLRHSDTSTVLKGAQGDASHSAFVLDYSLFERLVYNLVVGFDVYGNLTHQLHTRVYMGMIRMEAENNLLDFLPPENREVVRKDWYASKFLAKIEKKVIDKAIPSSSFSQIQLPATLTAGENKAALYKMILGGRLPYMLDLYPDAINWRRLDFVAKTNNIELQDSYSLNRLTSQSKSQGAIWVTRFPDSSLLVVKKGDAVSRIYTIVRNKRVKEIGSILFEKLMRQPEEDQLMILRGLTTSYPNYFFIVQESDLPKFAESVRFAKSDEAWSNVKTQWGLERTRPDFWAESDKIQGFLAGYLGINGGVVDYTHYDLWNN